jgi:hypothetical protein
MFPTVHRLARTLAVAAFAPREAVLFLDRLDLPDFAIEHF